MLSEPSPQEKAYGPYQDRRGYRVIVVDSAGRRAARIYATQAAAQAVVDAATRRTAGGSVRDALAAYIQHLRIKGNKPRTIGTTEHRLTSLYKPAIDTPVIGFSVERARGLYESYASSHAVDTHRNTLGQARTHGRWMVKTKRWKRNPWLDVEGVGQRSHGKDQLRIDEARKLWGYVRPRLLDDNGSCAVGVVLLLGLRVSEVVSLRPRDLDADGTILWIERGKTRNARRQLVVPGSLVAPLKELARLAKDRLFPYRREWVLDVAKRRAVKAGLGPDVTAHGLRGLHATLRVEYGDVQRALGHRVGSDVTRKHYLEPGTLERATAKKVQDILDE